MCYFISFNQKYDFILFTTAKNHEGIGDSNFLFKDLVKSNNKNKILVIGTFTSRIRSSQNTNFVNIYIIRYFVFLIRLWSKFYSIINKPKIYKNVVEILEPERSKNINHRKLRETIIRAKCEAMFFKLFLYDLLKVNSRKSKVVVFEDGFMSQHSNFINALNENAVETVEHQHGAIYPGHEA